MLIPLAKTSYSMTQSELILFHDVLCSGWVKGNHFTAQFKRVDFFYLQESHLATSNLPIKLETLAIIM